MNVRQAFEVGRTGQGKEIEMRQLANALDLGIPYFFENRDDIDHPFEQRWVIRAGHQNGQQGVSVLYQQGEPAAIAYRWVQDADETFAWVSREAFFRARERLGDAISEAYRLEYLPDTVSMETDLHDSWFKI